MRRRIVGRVLSGAARATRRPRFDVVQRPGQVSIASRIQTGAGVGRGSQLRRIMRAARVMQRRGRLRGIPRGFATNAQLIAAARRLASR